jgi:CheY-like chemotaxis protein
MPGLDGLETCRQLKRDPVTQDIPVIFITANDSAQSLVEGFRAGGVDFITKPFKAEEVLVRLETHLKIHRLTGKLTRQNEQLTRLNAELQAEILRRQQAEQSLSLIEAQKAERFHTGGTLGPDAPSYVERRADKDLLTGLLHGDFCYVLTARQMGKSSLMARIAKRLRAYDCHVVTLDLTAIGQNLTHEQWYAGLIAFMSWELELENEFEAFWLHHGQLGPVQRFFAAIRAVVLERSPRPVVIFVDELDMLRSLPFPAGEFLAAIREAYNARGKDPELNRLSFCLLGVATPSELIQDEHMTPFNIGKRIELEDFTPQEVAPLARGLGRDPPMAAELMDRIYYWTSGHPYLTQKLCKSVVAEGSVRTAAALDDLCSRLLLCPKAQEEDDNLLFVRDRLLRSNADLEQLLELYAQIRSGERIVANETNPLVAVLRLSGIIRPVDGFLRLRNRIYEQVFNRTWVQTILDRTL